MANPLLTLVPPQGPTKTCSSCGEEKPVPEAFQKDSRNKDGLFAACKGCLSKRSSAWQAAHPERILEFRRNRYNVDFNALWEAQGGLCGLCSEPMLPRGKGLKSVVIDHDHNCCPPSLGKACGQCVRGLLHRQCNMLLGTVEKNIPLIRLAESYLQKWRGTST